ncbi:hypothetical protein [Aquiflexum gelatinilyticum]|nr:hypothetical protein [Aquiflexum gelatinilyticum]MCS4435345.1 hypothetical protein [Aquiflexum gelatinilyticum]
MKTKDISLCAICETIVSIAVKIMCPDSGQAGYLTTLEVLCQSVVSAGEC